MCGASVPELGIATKFTVSAETSGNRAIHSEGSVATVSKAVRKSRRLLTPKFTDLTYLKVE